MKGGVYRMLTFHYPTEEGEETINPIESMEEKKKQAVESGSLYMTLDAFYRPVYLSMRGQGEEGFSRYISNNVRSHTTGREFIPDH